MTEKEAASIEKDLTPPFSIRGAEAQTSPLIFNSPHSGRTYPSVLLEASRLSPQALRKSEDAFVEELFGSAPQEGAVLIEAHFPRAYIDINREPYELDPALFDGELPDFANSQSLRAIGGLGTIARVVNEREEIYQRPLPVAAALTRIDKLYHPYHAALRRLIDETKAKFGCAFLIDCHSMPSQAQDHGIWPDFVLGDRFGTSCAIELTRLVQGFLRQLGYRVALNKPYAGGYITEHYGQPLKGVHVLQVEIDRSLYMKEETFEKLPSFNGVRWDMHRLIQMLANELPEAIFGRRMAAE
jgi:N-formylglutamate amidohydrolase